MIHKKQTGLESNLGKHVIVQVLHKYNVRMRMKQRNKQKCRVVSRTTAAMREGVIRSSKNGDYDEKWGAFKPEQRFKVDQSPLRFVISAKRTYDIVEKGHGHVHNTWVLLPGAGLDKRQCSLQICIRAEGKQPQLP